MSKPKVRIVILASGTGSNFEALYLNSVQGQLNAEICAVISDRANAPVLSKAKALGLPAIHVPQVLDRTKEYSQLEGTSSAQEQKFEHARALLKAIEPFEPRFLVLAGYMKVLHPHVIEYFKKDSNCTHELHERESSLPSKLNQALWARIVNVHPSLLPCFPGLNAYEQAFEYGAKVTGITIHLVDEGVDTGPVCAQEAFSINDCTSLEQVRERGLKVEHRLFSETLSWILPENFTVELLSNGRSRVCKN